MTWYDVKIQGRFDGRPRSVDATVKAPGLEAAVQMALAREFGASCSTDVVWSSMEMSGYPGPLVFTVPDDDDERGRLFPTDHMQLSDVVREVTDHARLARLDGAPELPLDFGQVDGPTAAPYAPDAYQRQVMAMWGGGNNLMPALLGLVGEAGEVADLHKKHFFKPGREATREMVLDELADVAYYVAVLAHLWEFTFDDMFAHLAGKLAGGHGWVNPSNSVGLEGDRE